MTLAELLPAIRALPQAEKAALMHILVDEVTAPTAPDATLLATLIPTGVSFDIATPPDGYEVAAELHRLLESEKRA